MMKEYISILRKLYGNMQNSDREGEAHELARPLFPSFFFLTFYIGYVIISANVKGIRNVMRG